MNRLSVIVPCYNSEKYMNWREIINKAKKAVGYLMAVVLCLGMFAGLMRGTTASPAQAEGPYNIVASLPEKFPYYDELINSVATHFSPNSGFRKLYYTFNQDTS